ncbi:M3 family oligoendopeptidase [Paenibacillus sp. 32O-W]|uniref:M3 family oligoendopeptidase n=1 Tax=Paenibacillus sp. 32O-W TaxID=1695218 RepID=UPI00119CE3D4|nr:M3 family oligoendopeptidase [Paenibacillus sp. 32O-W]
MKFSELVYRRPDLEQMEQRFKELLGEMNAAKSFTEQDRAMTAIVKLRNEFETLKEIAAIRHSIDTDDAFYKAEQDYMDEVGPIMDEHVTDYYRALVHSAFREELEHKYGKQLFRIAELSLKTFHPSVIEDLQRENKLATEYGVLIASAKIPFEGEERTLAQLAPFAMSTDRDMRRRASEAKYQFLAENERELDRIFDDLVQVRTKIAKKLGFAGFIELGYARMLRTDYNEEMVAVFRNQVLEHIIPVATKLKERQRERIGVERLRYYDEDFSFKSGNPAPQGDADWILENGARMYAELSPETDEFFTRMVDSGLMDLLSRKGKQSGGYCTFLNDYKMPFIFANFNGTSDDIGVLKHEAGHAFQAYESRDLDMPEYRFPTFEAAEIHSMSMEFITWPWMELFFREETEKYKFAHLEGALLFIPYGVAVDEFQHFVYGNPEATPDERKRAWRDIERKYLPHRDYSGNDYLERGGFWQKQSHIYQAPFYYIDYTLAQICALQFWQRMNTDRESAWQDYMKICKAGGSLSFTEIVELAGLVSPFEAGCVESVIGDIENWLDSFDDKGL